MINIFCIGIHTIYALAIHALTWNYSLDVKLIAICFEFFATAG